MDVEDVKMNEEEEEEQTLIVEVKEMLSDAKNMDNKEEALKKLTKSRSSTTKITIKSRNGRVCHLSEKEFFWQRWDVQIRFFNC